MWNRKISKLDHYLVQPAFSGRLKELAFGKLTFQPSASRTTFLSLTIPAVNCWAIIIRPLERGLDKNSL
jgi:hypothetical protein